MYATAASFDTPLMPAPMQRRYIGLAPVPARVRVKTWGPGQPSVLRSAAQIKLRCSGQSGMPRGEVPSGPNRPIEHL